MSCCKAGRVLLGHIYTGELGLINHVPGERVLSNVYSFIMLCRRMCTHRVHINECTHPSRNTGERALLYHVIQESAYSYHLSCKTGERILIYNAAQENVYSFIIQFRKTCTSYIEQYRRTCASLSCSTVEHVSHL